jgi:hypothetical protein
MRMKSLAKGNSSVIKQGQRQCTRQVSAIDKQSARVGNVVTDSWVTSVYSLQTLKRCGNSICTTLILFPRTGSTWRTAMGRSEMLLSSHIDRGEEYVDLLHE